METSTRACADIPFITLAIASAMQSWTCGTSDTYMRVLSTPRLILREFSVGRLSKATNCATFITRFLLRKEGLG
jgi:hypothetical protein